VGLKANLMRHSDLTMMTVCSAPGLMAFACGLDVGLCRVCVVVLPMRTAAGRVARSALDKPVRPLNWPMAFYWSQWTHPTDCVHLVLNCRLRKTASYWWWAGINHGANLVMMCFIRHGCSSTGRGRFLHAQRWHYFRWSDGRAITMNTAALIAQRHGWRRRSAEDCPPRTILNDEHTYLAHDHIRASADTASRHRSVAAKPVKWVASARQGKAYWDIGGRFDAEDRCEGTDFHAVMQGYVR